MIQNSRKKNQYENKEEYHNNRSNQLYSIVAPLLKWYDNHARVLPWRENPEPYAVWISEIMLQQTRVEAVKPYFDRWMSAFPDIFSLAAASEEEVLKLWEGLGYYSRVRNIHKTAKIVTKEYGGELPPSFDALLKLPGIGEYSAGSIGSIAFQLQVPCIDGNVMRVITRITAEEADITEASTKKLLTRWVSAIVPAKRPGDFNQALMELGATICLPNGVPKCESCPVSQLCEAFRRNQVTDFPIKKPKATRRKEKRTVLLLIRNGCVAVRKRQDSGLLAGLFEYPNFSGELTESEVIAELEKKSLSPLKLTKLKKAKHIFTHLEWHMNGYLITLRDDEDDSIADDEDVSIADSEDDSIANDEYQWIAADELRERLTIPSAFKVYHQILLEAFFSQ